MPDDPSLGNQTAFEQDLNATTKAILFTDVASERSDLMEAFAKRWIPSEQIPVVHSKSVGRRQAVQSGHDPAGEMITRAELERLRQSSKAGYELSRWVASINWDGGHNWKNWMTGLKQHVLRVQELWNGPKGGMQVEVREP